MPPIRAGEYRAVGEVIGVVRVNEEYRAAFDGVYDLTAFVHRYGGTPPAPSEPLSGLRDTLGAVIGSVHHDGTGEGVVVVPFFQSDETERVAVAALVGALFVNYAKMYITPGEWGKWVSGLTEGYITNGWVNGANTSNYSVVTVGYENGEYSFEFEINNKLYTYTGAVENLTAPVM